MHETDIRLTKNFHTHTFRCHHAVGDIDDYVREARRRGMTALGFSDHTPLPDKRWKSVRMRLSELSGYRRAIALAGENAPGMRLFTGLECEFSADYESFYRGILLGDYNLDYLVSGAHWFPFRKKLLDVTTRITAQAHLEAYADYLIAAMESGLFSFVVHPDMFAASYTRWDRHALAASRQICAAAERLGVPLEINCYGFRKEAIKTREGVRPKYPLEKFWETAADYKLTVIVSSDAHRPEDVGDLSRGVMLADKYGLTIVDGEALIAERRSGRNK